MAMKKHRTRVGLYMVEDASPLSDPAGDLTLAEIESLELRAARTVLLRVPSVDGEVLRFARKAMGLTQPEVAAILGVATETVSRWETDAEPFKRTVQLALGQLLGIAQRHGCDVVKELVAQKPPPRTLLSAPLDASEQRKPKRPKALKDLGADMQRRRALANANALRGLYGDDALAVAEAVVAELKHVST